MKKKDLKILIGIIVGLVVIILIGWAIKSGSLSGEAAYGRPGRPGGPGGPQQMGTARGTVSVSRPDICQPEPNVYTVYAKKTSDHTRLSQTSVAENGSYSMRVKAGVRFYLHAVANCPSQELGFGCENNWPTESNNLILSTGETITKTLRPMNGLGKLVVDVRTLVKGPPSDRCTRDDSDPQGYFWCPAEAEEVCVWSQTVPENCEPIRKDVGTYVFLRKNVGSWSGRATTKSGKSGQDSTIVDACATAHQEEDGQWKNIIQIKAK